MIAHVFLRPPTQLEKESLALRSNDAIIVAAESMYNHFSGFSFSQFDFREIKAKVNQAFFDWTINFGEKEIDGKCIADLLTVNHQSFWHYHKYRAYFQVREQLYEVEMVQQLASQYSNLYVYSNSGFASALELPSNVTVVAQSGNSKKPKAYTTLIRYAAFIVFRGLKSMLKAKPKNKHILIDKGIKQFSLDGQKLAISKSNIYLNNVFTAADSNFCIITDTDIPSLEKGGFSAKNHPAPKGNSGVTIFWGEYILLKALLSPKTWSKAKRIENEVKAIALRVRSSVTHPYDKLLANHLVQYSFSNKAYILKNLAWSQFLESYPAKSITSIDENSPMVLAIFDAAKVKGIARIAVQHGTIHQQHPAYVHSPGDAGRDVFPTLTLAWGKSWCEFLTSKACYPSSLVRVTGQQRTDIIPILEANKNKVETLLGFKHENAVMFASQPQQDETLRRRAAEDVFFAAKSNPSILMVVKLHPRESDDVEYYHSIAKEIGCTNYLLTIKTDLYALLSYSKVVITCFSTVGTEAVYFNKPLIILDHLKADVLGLVREGLATQTTNATELSSAINAFIKGDASINSQAFTHYIEQYAYKIDGNTSQRIVSEIKSLS